MHSTDSVELLARYARVSADKTFLPDEGISVARVTDATRPDAEALGAAGKPPDAVRRFTHDDAVAELRTLGAEWELGAAASAWVAGLWSASWAWRPALTGVLLARELPEHDAVPYRTSSTCRVCGTDAKPALAPTDAWYRRHTGGVPIDGDVPGYVLALEELSGRPRPVPSEYDRWVLRAVLTVLRTLPADKRYSAARAELKRLRLLDTTAVHAYGSVLEELALVGVVATAEHPGLVERWSDYVERDQRPNERVEVQAPLAWWQSSDGLREDVVREVFADFDTSEVDLDQRPTPDPKPGATIVAATAKRARALAKQSATKVPRSAGTGPASVGDVYAMRVSADRWVTLYVWSVDSSGARAYAEVEFLAGLFPEVPGPTELSDRVQPRFDGRWRYRAHSLEKAPNTRRVTQGRPAPAGDGPPPDRSPSGNAKDLRSLAAACFRELR
ncbi:hypothetical protein VSH64_42395 [Amycolatopsis rhabdoformis]|uniref:Uncharacterized protein n=1 Tax=Amycolatopsis rhabdoformis TaxID=1448059 RepID=A0ABZ1I699_9PSEU|nr:hypothetical protein [Amycolatopsis rhabdoformis]WSE29388.1 hypothetical protein VSH64_42395 [Amycolatopsis rhabdoformis]